MFLKSVELFGFKSFADRSVIEFQEGISALLGPNGCGKSNIVDSIKWVLGEQATKTLRAEKMEDIIFNGTDNRKPLGMAEVTLTLVNDGGVLPLEMPEITIKRRLYRSGESEYLINGAPVKLKEVRELFQDTGVGKSAYSIMEQGKIDQVLSNKPEDRRYLFEEAAGISKYKLKGQEAEKKLERTEENMRQVDGIIGEVRRSYETLKTQSEKTNRYRNLRDAIFTLDTKIQLLKLREFLDETAKKERELGETQKRKDDIRAEIDGINESLEANLDQVNSMESLLIENQKKLYGIDLEKSGKDNQIAILAERTAEFERQIGLREERGKAIEAKLLSFQDQIAKKSEQLAEYSVRIGEIENNCDGFQASMESTRERMRQNEQRMAELERQIKELELDNEIRQKELRELTDIIVNQLDAKLKETGYSYQDRKAIEEEMRTLLGNLGVHIAGRISLIEDSLRTTLSQAEGKKVLESTLGVLKESEQSVEGLKGLFGRYSQAIPAFIDEFLAPSGIITRKREMEGAIEEIRTRIQGNREEGSGLRQENGQLSKKIEEYRKTLEELRVNLARMKAQKTAVDESIHLLEKEHGEQKAFLDENMREIEAAKTRLSDLHDKIKKIGEERALLEKREEELKKELAQLEKRISTKNKDLVEKEKALKSRMEGLSRVQGQIEKIQIDLSSLQTEVRNLHENYRERYGRDLSDFSAEIYEIRENGRDLRDQLQTAREEQKKLGQVNLMAVEEFAEVKERYEFLQNQLEDLRKAKEDLKSITGQIRSESTELFLDTYEKIRKNFHVMFRRLFGGGRAELKLSDTDNVLESGIEIYVQPPGKKLENIALLSGGERSLTAVALLFATYMVKPSPFCILDEIDAALDEENVGRFVNLLREFGKTSQFVIITHNKKTVMGARTLLGVTMEESGISKIVAIRLDSEENEKGVNG